MGQNKYSVILDVDDVLFSCNQYALDLLYKETGIRHRLEEITDWGVLNNALDQRFKYFNRPEFYRYQPVLPGAKEFLYRLMKMMDVIITTSVYPQFMGERISRLHEAFPEFPMDHIMMGHRKDSMKGDIMLDDCVSNLETSRCDYPALFRRPWNAGVFGMNAVSQYNEFLALCDTYMGAGDLLSRVPKVICLVGPSGAGKNAFADQLGTLPGFQRIKTVSTSRMQKDRYMNASSSYIKAAEDDGRLFAVSNYCGNTYAAAESDIQQVLKDGNHAVLVMDINGCMAVKAAFPGRCVISYVEETDRTCIYNTLSKPGLRKEEITDRIAALAMEKRNAILADYIVKDHNVEEFIKVL